MSKINIILDEVPGDESILGQVIEGYQSDTILEMAGRLPGHSKTKKGKRVIQGLIVAIGNKERDHAHFHFFRTEKDKEKWHGVGGCIMLKDAKYYKHSGHTDTLTEGEMDGLIEFFNQTHPLGHTLWQQLVSLWNDNNPRYSIPLDTPMPDYTHDMPNYKK